MWPFSKAKMASGPFQPTLVFTPASTEIDKFITLALASGLISFSRLRDICADFDTDRTDEHAVDDLRNHLVAHNALTEWQCEKLQMMKWKGFFVDGFCLLSHLRKDARTTTYLAREIATGKEVALTFTPPDAANFQVNERLV